MGNLYSIEKSVTESTVVQQTITNIIIDLTSSCSQNQAINASIKISDIVCPGDITISNIKNNIDTKITMLCNSSQEIETRIKENLQNDLKQTVDQKVGSTAGLILSASDKTQINNLITEITNNFNYTAVSQCLQQSSINAKVEIEKLVCGKSMTITDISNNIYGSIAQQCVLNQSNITTADQKLTAKVKQVQSSANAMMAFSSSMCMSSVLLIAVAIVAITIGPEVIKAKKG